jgi:hypothetical protein
VVFSCSGSLSEAVLRSEVQQRGGQKDSQRALAPCKQHGLNVLSIYHCPYIVPGRLIMGIEAMMNPVGHL